MAAIHKKVITSQKGLRSTGGPDLLKWGLPGGGIKSAKVAPTPYVYYPPARAAPVPGPRSASGLRATNLIYVYILLLVCGLTFDSRLRE